MEIYNSRNYSILLNAVTLRHHDGSTTVEIILYYLTMNTIYAIIFRSTTVEIILYYLTHTRDLLDLVIYNSRNYSILLNAATDQEQVHIYNSRNYSILLNVSLNNFQGYIYNSRNYSILLNTIGGTKQQHIYNSRNYSILLNVPNSREKRRNLQQ